jgi:hypothetical protein
MEQGKQIEAENERCKYIKADGEQCKNNAIDGRMYCRIVAHREISNRKKRAKKVVRTSIEILLAFCTLLGGLTLVYGLIKNFTSITAGEPLRESPLSAPLTLTNTSGLFIPVDVRPTCFINKFVFPTVVMSGSALGGYQAPIPSLYDTDTIYCFGDAEGKLGWPGRFLSADVTIAVDYGLAIDLPGCLLQIPFVKKTTEKRFRTEPTGGNRLKWTPSGLQDDPVPPPHPDVPSRHFAAFATLRMCV